MTFSAASLCAVLGADVPDEARGLAVALSGGIDSTCLLTAAAALRPVFRDLPLRAIHVDHALQPAAAEFREACGRLCAALGVPLEVIEVSVPPGGSLEAAARTARYAGLAKALRPGECVLTAHHAQDQAETLLLQLLRGAGIKGMSAMPARRRLGAGWHLRPLLGVSKRELLKFARTSGITAVSDSMNVDPRFDRAYLRTELWPLIEARWPGAEAALSRTARHVANAQELLDQTGLRDVEKLRDGDALSVAGLRILAPVERMNAVRYWILARGLVPPSAARLTEALRQVIDAEGEHLPAVPWGEHALRRYRDRLFVTAAAPPRIDALMWPDALDSPLWLGEGLGRLRWVPQRGGLDPARLPAELRVLRRKGGETLKPHPRASTQTVQHLCQAAGLLPWMRDALPFVYAGNELIAVGDLWQDARWCGAAQAPGLGCRWEEGPVVI